MSLHQRYSLMRFIAESYLRSVVVDVLDLLGFSLPSDPQSSTGSTSQGNGGVNEDVAGSTQTPILHPLHHRSRYVPLSVLSEVPQARSVWLLLVISVRRSLDKSYTTVSRDPFFQN